MNKVKNQHYVPQASLRRFCGANRKVFVSDKKSGMIFNTNVKNVASETYLYDVKRIMHDPTEPEQFQLAERAFSQIEHIGQKAIDNVLRATTEYRRGREYCAGDSCVIASPDREALACFTVVQYLRTPDQREATATMTHALSKMFLNASFYPLGIKETEYNLELTEDHITKWHCINALSHGPRLALHVQDQIWIFGANYSSVPLVLSDTPVIKIPTLKNGPMQMSGFGCPGVKLIFPVAPDLVLFVYEKSHFSRLERMDGKCLQLKEDEVVALNQYQVINCRSRLFSPKNDFKFAEEILAMLPDLREPRTHRVELSGPFTEGVSERSDNASLRVQW